MPFVITSPCVADYSCVEACPVAAISPSPDEAGFEHAEQLFIDPRLCIDCEACVEACPIGAIYAADRVPARWQSSIRANAAYFEERSHV